MRRVVLSLCCLVPFLLQPAHGEQPPEFKKAYSAYTELVEQGKMREAIPHARKALEIALKSDAVDDKTTARVAFDLGRLLYGNHQLSESLDVFDQAIKFAKKGGGNQRLIANALIYRGKSFQRLYKHEEARNELEQALALLTVPDRETRIDRATALESLAWVEISMRRYPIAEEYAAESHSIFGKLLGERHPRTVLSLVVLSAANYKRGHHPKARDQLARALELAEIVGMASEAPGAEAEPVKFTLRQFVLFHQRVAVVYAMMGRPDDVEYHRTIASDLRNGTLPPNLRVVPVERRPPEYPRDALRRGLMGWTLLEFTVRKDGTTANIRVIDSTPKGYFEDASIKAVKHWRYEPPSENGKPVEVPRVRTMIQYVIRR